MKKTLVMILAVVMSIALFVGCAAPTASEAPASEAPASEAPASEAPAEEAPASEEPAEEEPAASGKTLADITVGFSQMENNMPWRIAETNSMANEAEARGVGNYIYTDAQSDTAKQLTDIESLIAQGVDYLVIAPREAEGLESAMESAAAASIPVILVDRDTAGERLTFVHSDQVWEGEKCAEVLAEALGGKGGVVELMGTEGASATIDRQLGFKNVLDASYPEMEIIFSQTADFTREEGLNVMSNALQTYGDQISAVYAHNDEMALGAIEAIEAAGKVPGEDILVISVDGQKSALEAVIDGTLLCSVECSPFFGPISFDIIEAHLAGETIEEEIINPDRIFTIDGAFEGSTKAEDGLATAF